MLLIKDFQLTMQQSEVLVKTKRSPVNFILLFNLLLTDIERLVLQYIDVIFFTHKCRHSVFITALTNQQVGHLKSSSQCIVLSFSMRFQPLILQSLSTVLYIYLCYLFVIGETFIEVFRYERHQTMGNNLIRQFLYFL